MRLAAIVSDNAVLRARVSTLLPTPSTPLHLSLVRAADESARMGTDGAPSTTAIDLGWASLALDTPDPRRLAETPGLVVALDGTPVFPGHGPATAAAIATAWDRLGRDGLLAALEGDFALLVFDRTTRSLTAARDAFGVRPLFYATARGGWACASQPARLRSLPGVDGRPDPRRAAIFAGSHYRLIDSEPSRSPFIGVTQLEGATAVTVDDRGVHRTSRFWTPSIEPQPEDEARLADRYRAMLDTCVRERLEWTSNAVFTLSGGLDSSTVLTLAARQRGAPRPAISTTYVDATYDERRDIEEGVDAIGRPWHAVEIGDPDVAALLRTLVAVHEEPVATATWLSHWLLANRARQLGHDALVGGLGGDELNAGEFEHFYFFFADLRRQGLEERLDREVAGWIQLHDHPVFRKSMAVVDAVFAEQIDFTRPGRILPWRGRMHRYAETVSRDFFDVRTLEPEMPMVSSSYLANRCWQDLVRETIPCCLRAEDRHAAALGLMSIDPLIDRRLVEFMFSVPATLKYEDGVTKRLLRRAMTGVLPESFRRRTTKTGWNAPAHRWFSGPGLRIVRDLVASRAFRERGVWNVPEVERLVDEHDAIMRSDQPSENHMMFLWQLLSLECWLEWCSR